MLYDHILYVTRKQKKDDGIQFSVKSTGGVYLNTVSAFTCHIHKDSFYRLMVNANVDHELEIHCGLSE